MGGGDFDAFLGRDEELSRIVQALTSGVRVATLVGPPGIGKTRVAHAAAVGLAASGAFAGGVHFAELGALESADQLLTSVMAALPWCRDSSRIDADALADRCARRGSFLLVLDDVEPLLESTRQLVDAIRRRAPEARFLVTCREPLGLRGETVFAIDALSARDAVQLFRVRAASTRARPGDLDDADGIERLVAKLDGNPLAIELAAARAEVLSPRAMLDHLDDRFPLLTRPEGAPNRHSSLRAAIELSWELLGPHERAALARLSVFTGSFDLSAAEAVLEEPNALERAHVLVRKSLLHADEDRFLVFESVRAFALEKLDDPARVRALKAQHYLDRWRARRLSEATRREVLRALPDWLDALDAASAADPAIAAELGIGMETAVYGRVPHDLHRVIVGSTLEAAERAARAPSSARRTLGGAASGETPATLLARARIAEARERRVAGDSPGALESLARARAVAPTDHPATVEVLRLMGQLERHSGRLEEARGLLVQALAAAETCGLHDARGPLLDDLAVVFLDRGELSLAEQHALDALAHHRRVGDRRYEGISLGHLGLVAHARGDLDEAERRYVAALAMAREVGDARFDDFTRAFLAMVAFEQGSADRARAALESLPEGADAGLEPADPRAHSLLACAEAALVATRGKTAEAAELLAQARTRLGADCESERRAIAIVADGLTHTRAVAVDPAQPRASGTSINLTPTGVEQRLALRLVEAMRAQAAPRLRVLDVGPDGRWFAIDGRARVSLARRRSLRLLFAFLVRMRERSPGVGASWQELLSAGWPGEKVVPSAGQRRVYVAIGTLRSLGLAEVLLHTDDGYLVDPAVTPRGSNATGDTLTDL